MIYHVSLFVGRNARICLHNAYMDLFEGIEKSQYRPVSHKKYDTERWQSGRMYLTRNQA